MKLELEGKVDSIFHQEDLSTMWIDVKTKDGIFPVKIERPMLKDFEWQRDEGESIESGDRVRLTLEKIEEQNHG